MKHKKYFLKNNLLRLSINGYGAELSSIQADGLEYMWQGDAKFWGRHSPVLFPFVGLLLGKEYSYQGRKYAMGQHGFARNHQFELVEQADNSLTFELMATQETKKIYPFDFVLQIKYTLVGSSVKVAYLVINPSIGEDLYFSIGAHPAFNCPFEAGQKRSEYQLIFDTPMAPMPYLAEHGIYTGEVVAAVNENGEMGLPDSIFNRGSLTFWPNPFSKVDLLHKPTGKKYLSVRFENFPFLGIWSSNDKSPFVCIEPWHGIADLSTHNQELTDKVGINKLLPNTKFECAFFIEINTDVY